MKALLEGRRMARRLWRRLRRIGRTFRLVRPARSDRLDLLFGSRAIAHYMGLTKGQTREVLAKRALPTFELAGVTCARRSSIRRHLRLLERR